MLLPRNDKQIPFGYVNNGISAHTHYWMTSISKRTALIMLCSQKEPRVRIPNSPPRSPVNKRVCRTFLFCSFAQNRLKTMERTACFLERTRRFRAFWRIRTVKISSFRHRLKFRSTCCRNSPIREVPFR